MDAPIIPQDKDVSSPQDEDRNPADSNSLEDNQKLIDGIVHEFDSEKKAWFPLINQEILLQQQSVYKVDGVDDSTVLTRADIQRKRKAQVMQTEKKVVRNTAVFVQGLPLDADVYEIADYFKKCGIILDDIATGEPKVKLYLDHKGRFKGEALVVYFKEESVVMVWLISKPKACNLLDDTVFRDGAKIKVTKAVFKEKEPVTKEVLPKEKIRHKIQKLQSKLDWDESESTSNDTKISKTVVLKHMFTMQELEEDPTLLLDLKQDVRDECSKLLGEITNVVLYDKSKDGVMTVKFKKKESALACIKLMHGRWFAKRRIVAEMFDGTKYEKSGKEEEGEAEERLESFSNWIESN